MSESEKHVREARAGRTEERKRMEYEAEKRKMDRKIRDVESVIDGMFEALDIVEGMVRYLTRDLIERLKEMTCPYAGKPAGGAAEESRQEDPGRGGKGRNGTGGGRK